MDSTLKKYLLITGGRLRYISGGLVAIEYKTGSDLFDDYITMLAFIKNYFRRLEKC